MNWSEAVVAMRAGCTVRRASEIKRVLLNPEADLDLDLPIYDCGAEGCYLAAGWTDQDEPVHVFMGSLSKTLFVPDDEHRAATDWLIEG